jgi:ABC-type transport system substrate-binding protein
VDPSGYWKRKTITRRAVLGAATAAGGAAAFGLAACSSGARTSGSSSKATATGTQTVLNPASGKRGGTFIIQQYGDPGGGLELIKTRNAGVHQFAGFVYDGLLEVVNGTPAHDGYDFGTQPNLAQAMPEQPDPQTFVFKLRPAKFQNGRAMTSDDVKWSFETYASSDSGWKNDVIWIDHVETPDPQTAVVKAKFAYADAPQAMAARMYLEIMAREFQESADATKSMMGTGPFLFVDYQPPIASHYKLNPDYHRQPYPYFDMITFLGNADDEKKIAEFVSHQVDMTYYFPPQQRDRVKQARKDAQLWSYIRGSDALIMRTDKAPFNDVRVRQALSMAIDRTALSKAVAEGEGQPDQALSIAGKYWGFRKPSELGAASKYWNHDPQAAKQLLSAAGVSLPLKFQVRHWNASVVGQQFVDNITLIAAQWRQQGIADVQDIEETFGESVQNDAIGNYQDATWSVNPIAYQPELGLGLKNAYYWPAGGIKGPPTLNVGYVHDDQLNPLLDKQLGQYNLEERKQTLAQIEEILAENQYRITGVTTSYNFFGDPSVKNMQVPIEAANGSLNFVKYWWFA